MRAIVLIIALFCLVMVGCKKEETKPVETQTTEEVKTEAPAPVEKAVEEVKPEAPPVEEKTE